MAIIQTPSFISNIDKFFKTLNIKTILLDLKIISDQCSDESWDFAHAKLHNLLKIYLDKQFEEIRFRKSTDEKDKTTIKEMFMSYHTSCLLLSKFMMFNKIYQFEPYLCWEIKNTHCKKIPGVLLKLPFPIVYVSFKNNLDFLKIHQPGVEGEDFEIDGFIAKEIRVKDGDKYLFIYFTGSTTKSIMPNNPIPIPIKLSDDNKTISELIEDVIKTCTDALILEEGATDNFVNTHVKELLPFAITSIMYIISNHAVMKKYSHELPPNLSKIKSSKKRAKLMRKMNISKTAPLFDYTIVGDPNIKLKPGWQQKSESTDVGKGKHSYRYIVSGYFRPAGKKWNREFTHVAPYWRGPEVAQVVHKNHRAPITKQSKKVLELFK